MDYHHSLHPSTLICLPLTPALPDELLPEGHNLREAAVRVVIADDGERPVLHLLPPLEHPVGVRWGGGWRDL